MVEHDLAARDIDDRSVLEAMAAVPRHEFVWDIDKDEAYADRPLRIGEGQTISQPYMVALMSQKMGLRGADRVLEIGTGSGYQTAVLAHLSGRVYTVERHPSLSERAAATLSRLGYENVEYLVGDGTVGWPDNAPYDAIMVTAGAPSVPDALRGQLADGGRLVIPVGGRREQDLLVVTRRGDSFETKKSIGCIFVKLVGEQGWAER
jgi:protein-L-isoaspartate(D-aspartate) O-methyltransferase